MGQALLLTFTRL